MLLASNTTIMAEAAEKSKNIMPAIPPGLTAEMFCGVCKLCTETVVDLGSPGNHQHRPCARHEKLLSWIKARCEEEIYHSYGQSIPALGSNDFPSFVSRQPGRLPRINYYGYSGHTSMSCRELLLSMLGNETRSGLHQHMLDPKWIDLQVVRQWMDNCQTQHGSRCCNPFKASICYPAYLIDTDLNCIIQPGKYELEYVALSYRWGKQEAFRMNRINVEGMKDPGGLSRYYETTPPTIRDAMNIVRSIGERYLWVDSMCLISDDTEHLAQQLQLMGLIYARAKLTIVATDGDAWDGIHGICGTPAARGKPRDLQNVFRYDSGMQIAVREHPWLSQTHGPTSEYFQRGWTYQEYYLSQRRLIFGKKQIMWSCSCAMWHEDDPEPEQDADQRVLERYQIPNILNGKPDFRELEKLMSDYHTRDFACPDDALPGVTGLLTLLSRTFEGGFICGQPQAWFDAALMWHSFSLGRKSVDDTRRRASLGRRTVGKQPYILPEAVLPSWSWIGWKGDRLQLLGDEEDFELPHGLTDTGVEQKYITAPITTWYGHETPSSDRIRIKSSLQQNLELFGSLKDCFEGWVVEEYNPGIHEFNGRDKSKLIGKKVYRHSSVPHRYFWRPFPRRNVKEDTSIHAPKQYQYISCRTQRAWFYVKAPDRDFFGFDRNHLFPARATLMNDIGRECGWVQLSPADDVAFIRERDYGWLVSHEDEKLSGRKVELVAVCHRRKSCPCWLSGEEECWGHRELYGVLWIEWTDGVAYRRGCGHVFKQIWDGHELEDIDLVMG